MSNSGILLINKPKDMTSHDLVNITRRTFHTKKVGHNGTLDPDATGVMVLSVNHATRLNEYLVYDIKSYRAVIRFGQETDTQDISGEVVSNCDLPKLEKEEFESILGTFLGPQKQTPPMYSAIKKNGKPLYKYAREGIDIGEIPARDIEIFSLKCISYASNEATIDVCCSKGTYIRTLCQDIARKCGSCGCMSDLTRTKEGKFALEDCISIDELRNSESPYDLLTPSSDALAFPKIVIESDADIKDLFNGKAIKLSNYENTDLVIHDDFAQATYQGELVSVGRIDNGYFVPKKVFHI